MIARWQTIGIGSVCFAFVAVSAFAQTVLPSGYAVRQTATLTRRVNGVDGRLDLLTDTRIAPDTDDEKAYDLRPARLRVVTSDGQVAQTESLERSRANWEVKRLSPTGSPTFLLTVDYRVGAGSYNGPITFFVEVKQGRLRYLSAGGKRISVMRSLKTDWKLVRAARGTGTDILEVACRPNATLADDADKGFDTIYTRYHWNGTLWTRRVRRVTGFWESEGIFPHLSRFPRG